jgi:hypothetical protein
VGLVLLGSVGYGVLGAAKRLRREVAAMDEQVRPVTLSVQEVLAGRAAREPGAGQPPA